MDISDNGKLNFSWLPKSDSLGEMLFTFDGEKIFNLFRDYPNALTSAEKKLFDEANPFWANFFKDRKYKNETE